MTSYPDRQTHVVDNYNQEKTLAVIYKSQRQQSLEEQQDDVVTAAMMDLFNDFAELEATSAPLMASISQHRNEMKSFRQECEEYKRRLAESSPAEIDRNFIRRALKLMEKTEELTLELENEMQQLHQLQIRRDELSRERNMFSSPFW